MARRVDPRCFNSFIDAHMLDRAGGPEEAAVDRILALYDESKIGVLLPHSVKREIEHPNTPAAVKDRSRRFVYTEPVSLTAPEQEQHAKARALLQGNAQPGRHAADAFHVVESAKYGGGYFITLDTRMHKKAKELEALLGIIIVAPSRFVELYDEFERKWPRTQ